MRGAGVLRAMFATVLLASVLSVASPTLTPGPEVVLDPLFLRYPRAPLSIGGTRDAIVVAGTTIVGNDVQAFYQVVDGAPRDRVYLTGRSQYAQVATSGADTLVAWDDPTGTEIRFPFHPGEGTRHVANGMFGFAIPTPDGFRVFSNDRFGDFSSVTISADGSSIGMTTELLYASAPAVQSRTHLVFGGALPSADALYGFPPGFFVSPANGTSVEIVQGQRWNGPFLAAATKGDSAVFLMQTTLGFETIAVDLAGEPRVSAPQRILITNDTTTTSPSMAWTGANYLVVWNEKAADRTSSVRGLLLDDAGKPAGAPFLIAANAEAPAVTGLGRGEAAVVYVTTETATPLPQLVLRRLSPPPGAHRRAAH